MILISLTRELCNKLAIKIMRRFISPEKSSSQIYCASLHIVDNNDATIAIAITTTINNSDDVRLPKEFNAIIIKIRDFSSAQGTRDDNHMNPAIDDTI